MPAVSPAPDVIGAELDDSPGVDVAGAAAPGEGAADDDGLGGVGVGSGGGVIDGVGAVEVVGCGGSDERLQPLSARVQANAPAPSASKG